MFFLSVDSKTIVIHPTEKNYRNEQIIQLDEPMVIPNGYYLGVFRKTYPPKLQYRKTWDKREPGKVKVCKS